MAYNQHNFHYISLIHNCNNGYWRLSSNMRTSANICQNISSSLIIFNNSHRIYIKNVGYVPLNIVPNRELFLLFLLCFLRLNDPFFIVEGFWSSYTCAKLVELLPTACWCQGRRAGSSVQGHTVIISVPRATELLEELYWTVS